MKAETRLSSPSPKSSDNEPAAQTFIPDLCQVPSVLLMLILTQLFCVVVSLVMGNDSLLNWAELGLLSIYSHIIVLSCSAVICVSRKHLVAQSARASAVWCLAIILGTTYLISHLCAVWLGAHLISHPTLFIWRSVLVSALLGILLLRYFYLQFQWREQKQAELRSRIAALQARIRPHFLFNSMNSIASLIAVDPQRAEDAVLDLSTLFRATLRTQDVLITLSEELALCRRYLNIEALRLGERLKLEWSIAEGIGHYLIPPLTLQPLLENAIYHGIQPLTRGGTIRIESYAKKGIVYVLISNPFDAGAKGHQGNQIALTNIRHRFVALFGEAAILKTSQLDQTYTVTLRFPAREVATQT
ncbi:MAG: sensor histidine kinase [Oleiphilaceae bacterium]|nr:sensor histidine kinase [Oleiphilaceae bacterium]